MYKSIRLIIFYRKEVKEGESEGKGKRKDHTSINQRRLDTHHTASSRHVTLQCMGSYQYSQSQYETSFPKVITENY